MSIATPVLRQIGWIVLGPFLFGYGISELNALQVRWVCEKPSDQCLGLTESEFAFVTAIYTVGGAVSSLACAGVSRRWCLGRRANLLLAATASLFGSSILSMATRLLPLLLGRLLQGLGAGIAVVQVPLYLQEIAPPTHAGPIGTMNQLSVVFGIFVAQLLGTWVVVGEHSWRWVPTAGAFAALGQIVAGSAYGEESPAWLEQEGAALGVPAAHEQANEIRRRLGGPYGALSGSVSLPDPASRPSDSSAYAKGLRIVILTQLAQQFSGVNAILYYSTGILSTLLPSLAPAVGLLITLVNAVMTLPPLWLLDEARFGRRRLLLVSSGGMGIGCFVLAFGLAHAHAALSAVAIVSVIGCFSMGLGPVPFVILPEVLPADRVSAGASLGLGVNWLSNITVALLFPPLRSALGSWDHHTGSGVFLLLGAVNMVFAALIYRLYRTPAF